MRRVASVRTVPAVRGGRGVLIAALLLVMAAAGCDESLPPRMEPAVVLVPSISLLWAPTIVVRDSIPMGTPGSFDVRVLNAYDEVLQDTGRIRVNLDVWLKEAPEARATVDADEGDLVNGNILWGRILTLGVDTAAIIQKQWSHRTDDGTPFWSYLPLHPGSTPGGEPFCESDTVSLVTKGTVQLFNIVQPQVLPEQEFRIVYRIFGITCQPPNRPD